MDDFGWSYDFVDEDGNIDYESFMEAAENDPRLMEQYRDMLGEYEDVTHITDDDHIMPEDFPSLVNECVYPNLISAFDSVWMLVLACCFCNLLRRTTHSKLSHMIYIITGVVIMYTFFKENVIGLLFYVFTASWVLTVKSKRNNVGVILSLLTVVAVILCEFMVAPERWHNIRGAQMIISMKVISLGFDLSNEVVKDTDMIHVLSYILHPGSCIFGPWLSYTYYMEGLSSKQALLDLRWFGFLVLSLTYSCAALLWSTCFTAWLIPSSYGLNKWIYAYRDAQSFRFSHYFVCSLAEATLLMSGIFYTNPDGKISSYNTVSRPFKIEIPRSLVDVVTNWNLPMHQWLKNYVFRTARPRYGIFAAILFTYVASSLLHGLNFQLAAVLLSQGLYSYIEHNLRTKFSEAFSLCCESRPCRAPCEHTRKWSHPVTLVSNILFMLLSMFHLAYLGVMFDTSSGEQEKGYSMEHTLSKWSNLNFTSHFVVLFSFLFYLMVK